MVHSQLPHKYMIVCMHEIKACVLYFTYVYMYVFIVFRLYVYPIVQH